MSRRLFDVPAPALDRPVAEGFPAGGFGVGHFTLDAQGQFRRWRMHPGQPENDTPVPQNRFGLWTRQGNQVSAGPLAGTQHRLFPFTWTQYRPDPSRLTTLDSRLVLESLAFSPLLPGTSPERSLPLQVITFRARNRTDEPLEAALLLTWACGWPAPVPTATFDFQHDNLCLTGSLGTSDSQNRQGIAVPDLHYVGIYLQGIEPWSVQRDEAEVWEDFAEDGELDPRIARTTPQGAAAWVKFDLEPDETKEVPFVLTWHFPLYESGPAMGEAAYYTQFLGRRRPDNAIVWLAEQAVQHYGAETANYRYWQQQLEDWQRTVLAAEGALEGVQRIDALAALLDADTVWTEEGLFRLVSAGGRDLMPATKAQEVVRALWPDIGRELSRAPGS